MSNAEHKTKAVILLSGGLYFMTALAIAKIKGFECYSINFNYGQKQKSELKYCQNFCHY